MQIWSESGEWVAGNQIGVSVQSFLELQGGKHCKLLVGNIWWMIILNSQKQPFWRNLLSLISVCKHNTNKLIHFKEHNLTLILYSAFFTTLEVIKCLQHLITVIARSFFSIGTGFCRLWTSSKINQKNSLNVTLGYRLLKNCECGQIVSIISILHVCSSMRVQNESFSSLTPRPNL